jgi:hypothetical protein
MLEDRSTPSPDDLLDKEAAADYIGCGVRKLEMAASAGDIARQYVRQPGVRQRLVRFRRADLDHLKLKWSEREQQSITRPAQELQPGDDQNLRTNGAQSFAGISIASSSMSLENIMALVGFHTLDEAAAPFGISPAHLEHAISEGALPVYNLPGVRGRRVRLFEVIEYLKHPLTRPAKPKELEAPKEASE